MLKLSSFGKVLRTVCGVVDLKHNSRYQNGKDDFIVLIRIIRHLNSIDRLICISVINTHLRIKRNKDKDIIRLLILIIFIVSAEIMVNNYATAIMPEGF